MRERQQHLRSLRADGLYSASVRWIQRFPSWTMINLFTHHIRGLNRTALQIRNVTLAQHCTPPRYVSRRSLLASFVRHSTRTTNTNQSAQEQRRISDSNLCEVESTSTRRSSGGVDGRSHLFLRGFREQREGEDEASSSGLRRWFRR